MAADNPIRILFVEDLPSDMELAEHELRRESILFTSLRVETREEFLKALVEFQLDLIISDYALPEFDGMQALKLCREQYPVLPFIILTGSMNEETAVACMKAGATDYVIKERIKRLPFAVQEALEQQKFRSEKELAERSLRLLSLRQEAILAAVPDIIMEVDNAKVYTWANKAGKEFFGSDVIGKKADFYFAGEQDTLKLLQPIFNGSESVIYIESLQRRRDGQKRLLAWWCRVLKSEDGHVTGAISSARDITERKQAEEALQESEARYRILFESINDAVFVHNIEEAGVPGGFSQVNDVACKRLGYTREELLALTPRDITTPEAYEIISAARASLLSKGESIIETVHVTKDGRHIPVESNVRLFNYLGRQAAISIARDITERKMADMALLESEREFRTLAEAMPQIVWITRPDGWNIYFNQQWVDYTGMTLQESYGHGWNIPFHPDDRQRAWDAWQNATTNDATYALECRLRRADGAYRWWLIRGVPFRDADGKILKWFGTCTDIENLKLGAEALRKSEKQFRDMAENISDGLMILEENRPIFINDRACEITGYSHEELMRMQPSDIIAPEYKPLLDESERQFNKTGAMPQILEFQIIHKDGTKRFVSNHYSARIDKGEIITRYIIMTDITERMRSDEEKEKLRNQLFQSQKMETVGHLAGGIAHDFNNILSAIIGYASLMQEKMNIDDPLYSNVDHILSASERAATLVHSLLAFSRKQTLSVKQVKINDLVSSVSKLLVRLLGEDVTLETAFTFRDPIVMADAGQIDQILFNLATNARDAMPEGGQLAISTDITAIDDTYINEHGFGVAGDYALITVSDTGAGMDKATQEKIFEPFFTTKEVGKGTGLGLSTAYGIVKQHNGFINCYSEPGKGTTFKIYLPLLESDKKEEDEKTGKTTELMPGGKETILLAEDDVTVRELMKHILSQYGYTVFEVEDGAQAVQVFTEHAQEVDLLLFDVIMPKKNGKKAYKEIHNIRPGVPVIFTSGYTADIIHSRGFLDDGFELILKPVSMTALLQKVREVLDRKRQ